MGFEPIAITGRACVLPGAHDAETFAKNLFAGRDELTDAPPERWRLSPGRALGPSGRDCAWSSRGGYVTSFDEIFDPGVFALDRELVTSLDPLFHWSMYCAREALLDAGVEASPKVGVVLGNLSFPSESMTELGERIWLERNANVLGTGWQNLVRRPAAHNRFMSGLPAHLVSQGLGLGPAFAIDAACATSLYALQLAAFRLWQGEADVMLAGAVNRADSLFLHVGFCALNAMSPTGLSRPFHAEADGLVPAEGAAFVTLERLADARRRGRPILGIIRGIGLSNDGRGRGFLAPSRAGQVRALRAAYDGNDVRPADVKYVECHATGTRLGDATELESIAEVFEDGVAVGSHKSNLGHAITAAGFAGLLKVLATLERGQIPATLHVDDPVDASSLRIVTELQPFEGRFAGVNAFGFGGNNAHVVVERGDDEGFGGGVSAAVIEASSEKIAVVAVEIDAGEHRGAEAVFSAWLQGKKGTKSFDELEIDLDGLRFPPRDLEQTLGQQIAILDVARRATEGLELDPERTSVLVGMGCDTEIVRYGGRWRVAQWGDALGWSEGEVEAAQNAFVEQLQAQGVIGSMPNVVANRINSQLDVQGPSFSVSSEELSGLRAIEIAGHFLRHGLADTVVVGSVELADEEVHRTAHAEVTGETREMGDAAIVLVLQRLDDAEAAGRDVLAILEADEGEAVGAIDPDDVREVFGDTHAASSLLATALAVRSVAHASTPGTRGGVPQIPSRPGDARELNVRASGLGEQTAGILVRSAGPVRGLSNVVGAAQVYVVDGESREEVVEKLRASAFCATPRAPHRVAFVATAESRDARAAEVAALLESGRSFGSGIHYREAPLAGELAFVFTGSASPYVGMAAGLTLAMPSLVDALGARLQGDLRKASRADSVYGVDADSAADPRSQIASVSWVSLLHAELSRNVLGLEPAAAIGYSLGESTALMSLGAWNELDHMLTSLEESPLFAQELAGDFTAVRKAWAALGEIDAATAEGDVWQNWTIVGDVERVRKIVASEPACYVTMINADDECSIGGAKDACERALGRLLDDPKTHASPLPYSVAIHAPVVQEASESFRRLHHRPTIDVPGVRFYSNATGAAYEISDDLTADLLLAQATDTIDFRRTIRQAWDDGVRVFVEHGPRGLCTGWIGRILGPDRAHLAVSLDRPGVGDVANVLDVCAQLVAAGVAVDWRAFVEKLPVARQVARTRPLQLAARRPPVEFRAPSDVFCMPLPPDFPPPLVTSPPRDGVRAEPSPVLVDFAPTPVVAEAAPASVPSADIGRLHAEFLRTQAQVHEQFLAHYQSSVNMLLEAHGTRSSRPTRSVLRPASPAPTPTPTPLASSSAVVFSREDLEYLAHGEISTLFGPQFEPQDAYALQVRMPRPPLLLCDRVTTLEAEPASMKPGRIVTETDVADDSWYLHQGRMPAGIMIESGQADLLLVSYLGVDLLNKGERAYRLLGCKLTYTGELPEPGDTLRYDIEIDGFAKHEDVRLFFFHYDCTIAGRVRLQVRNGQAGFFTRDELDASGGILWTPENGEHDADAPVAEPLVRVAKEHFDASELRAFAEGRVWDCFGPGWELTKTHLRSPTISADPMLFLDRVTALDYRGGPWGKGYLRAETDVERGDWFFEGHFHNDPCMPGTLMFEGALQAMAFYLTANGFTIDRDGWRFQPVQNVEYEMRCRGQVDPDSRHLVYEIFVEELQDGEDGRPRLFADMLVTVDGLKAFWCRRMGLELVPDYPMPRLRRGDIDENSEPLADEDRVRATQIGWPSDAFGEMYERFDGPRRVPRLPGPPYDAVSRVVRASGRGSMQPGAEIVTEFDVAADAWYLAEGGGEMPLATLLEVGLQPCGWLASWVGCTLQNDDVFFRNLDGTGTLHRPVTSRDELLTTRALLTKLSRSGPMTIVGFDVAIMAGPDAIYSMQTVFGFFPAEALASQAGIADQDPATLPSANGGIEQLVRSGRLDLFDRVVARSERRIVCEMDVEPEAWFFKAHFFSDPVQPGSLGLQLIVNAFALLGVPFDLSAPHTWKYRGQVRPHNRVVTVDAQSTDHGPLAHLWVDGTCIYRFS